MRVRNNEYKESYFLPAEACVCNCTRFIGFVHARVCFIYTLHMCVLHNQCKIMQLKKLLNNWTQKHYG